MSAQPPRILVIGAGSIGSRHAGNLARLGADVSLTDPEDELAQARASTIGDPVRAVVFDERQWGGYDGIVVASPTVFHRDQATAALATGTHVLVEKPLTMDLNGLDGLVSNGRGRLMVGFNLRLHRPVERVVELALGGRAGRILSIRLWFGSYLPDWRPGQDYRRGYAARAALGGGVLLDAIHELDLLVWLVGGQPEVVGALIRRVGDLEIDSEDTVRALCQAEGLVAEVSLDYLSRHYRRGIEVIGQEATLRLDWARQSIEIEDQTGIISELADDPIAVSYEREASRFLEFIVDGTPPPVSGEIAALSARLADDIRTVAQRANGGTIA